MIIEGRVPLTIMAGGSFYSQILFFIRRFLKMIVISKEEAKMLRKKFPGVHMVTTVNKTMVDELPYVLQALPNNYFAQEALAEMERDKRHTGIVNTRGDVNA
jgi:hypothetical protein